MSSTQLLIPDHAQLGAYVDALERGWSPDNVRGKTAANEQIEEIRRDPDAFIKGLNDPEAKGPPIRMPDGTTVRRLPGIHRWIWDGGFCGVVGLRWQPGTSALPPHVLGHLGFAVVEWKRRLGHASRALSLMSDEARDVGLDYVDLVTGPANIASQKVIARNGGKLVRRFFKPARYGGDEALLYRIDLTPAQGARTR